MKMRDAQNIIGITDLLDEVSRDLDEFRKKHQSDYGVKNITLWWDTERERLLVRHLPTTVVRTIRRMQNLKRILAWFGAGVVTMIALDIATRLMT